MMLDAIKKRRSIRQYTQEAVSEADVKALLEAAMAAPSAHNAQPYEFILVRREDLRRQLAETHQWSDMCADAPVVIVVCGHERGSDH